MSVSSSVLYFPEYSLHAYQWFEWFDSNYSGSRGVLSIQCLSHIGVRVKTNILFITDANIITSIKLFAVPAANQMIRTGHSSSSKLGGQLVKTSALEWRSCVRIPPEYSLDFSPSTRGSTEYEGKNQHWQGVCLIGRGYAFLLHLYLKFVAVMWSLSVMWSLILSVVFRKHQWPFTNQQKTL